MIELVNTAAYDARKRDAEKARTLLLSIRLQLSGIPD